jgi:hypothetical protein
MDEQGPGGRPGEQDDYVYGWLRGHYPDGPPDGVLDLGHDVLVKLTAREGYEGPVGLIETHRSAEGHGCGGSVTFDVPGAEGLGGPRWQVISLDPLHIEPSVLCSCGHHGFIREGRWIPA